MGSASPDLIKKASESLAGGVEFIDMQGFNIVEPESFIKTFLQRDILQFGINIPAATLRRFWIMLAHSHGQILNSSLRTDQETIFTTTAVKNR